MDRKNFAETDSIYSNLTDQVYFSNLVIIISILPTKVFLLKLIKITSVLLPTKASLSKLIIITAIAPTKRNCVESDNNYFHLTDQSVFVKTDRNYFSFTTDQSIFVKTDNNYCNFTDQRIIVENDDDFTDHRYFYRRLIKKVAYHPPPLVSARISWSVIL